MNDRFHHLYIAAADFEASVAFYRDILGWSVMETWGGRGAPRGARISGGGISVVVGEHDGAAVAPGAEEARGPHVHLDIHDLEKRFGSIPPGAHVVREPERTHWGTRWFVLRDPDGNLIAFEQLHGH